MQQQGQLSWKDRRRQSRKWGQRIQTLAYSFQAWMG